MKQYLYFCGLILCAYVNLHAQVNVNISAPVWGPKITTEEYYYLPDIDSYYDIHQSQFIYVDNGVWIRSRSLPRRYRNYNLNTGHVFVINDYHGTSPYVHYKNHRVKYFTKGNSGRGNGNKQGNRGNGKGKQNKKGK